MFDSLPAEFFYMIFLLTVAVVAAYFYLKRAQRRDAGKADTDEKR